MLTRHELADLTERLVDALDAMDPDPDLEANGDEHDGQFSEDEPAVRFAIWIDGPGCSFSDGTEDGDENYSMVSDDRGSSGPNAQFPGHLPHNEIVADADCERWYQPVELY